MTKPFKIRQPETRVEYELADVAFFVREYQPQGFAIVDPAPTGYRVPEPEELGSIPEEVFTIGLGDGVLEFTDLNKLTRAELDLYAAELGIENPEGHSNKAALIEAIETKRAE